MQLYLEALQAAFGRHRGASEEVLELSRRIASSYSGFVQNASGSVAEIVRGAVRYAFQVRPPTHTFSNIFTECYLYGAF